jgi:hypothetical protein
MYLFFTPFTVRVKGCDIPIYGTDTSVTCIINTMAIMQTFNKIYKDFSADFKKNKLFFWYIEFGMDEEVFRKAEESINKLLSKYQVCHLLCL